MEDNDPVRKKSGTEVANDDFNIDEIINQSDSDSEVADNQDEIEKHLDAIAKATVKRKHLASVLEGHSDEEEIENMRGFAENEKEEVKVEGTEYQDDKRNLAGKGTGNTKCVTTSDVNLLGDQGRTTSIKSEPTDSPDQDSVSDQQSDGPSIAMTSESYKDRVFLDKFIKTNTTKRVDVHYCLPCGKSYYQNSIHLHVRDKHPRTRIMYKCPKCEITKSNKNTFTVHIIKEHPELRRADLEQWIVYPCPICKRNMKSKQDRISHVSRKHPRIKHGSISESSSNVSESSDVGNGEKAMSTKAISSLSSQKKDLRVLFKEIVKQKKRGFNCKACDKSHASHAGIYVHVKDKHFYAGAKYKCWRCGQIKNSESYLRKHFSEKHPNHKVDVDHCRVL